MEVPLKSPCQQPEGEEGGGVSAAERGRVGGRARKSQSHRRPAGCPGLSRGHRAGSGLQQSPFVDSTGGTGPGAQARKEGGRWAGVLRGAGQQVTKSEPPYQQLYHGGGRERPKPSERVGTDHTFRSRGAGEGRSGTGAEGHGASSTGRPGRALWGETEGARRCVERSHFLPRPDVAASVLRSAASHTSFQQLLTQDPRPGAHSPRSLWWRKHDRTGSLGPYTQHAVKEEGDQGPRPRRPTLREP